MTSRVTLVIPTKDRPTLLRRGLSYYKQTGFTGTILIADSTEQAGFDAFSRWLSEFSGPFSVKHFHLPGLSFAAAIRELTGEIFTPYVAVIPDDDFLIPSGVTQCANFLDKNSKYVAAHGLGILIGSKEDDTEHISSAEYYPQPIISDELASDRITNQLRNYSVSHFSTQRTKDWIKVFDAIPYAKDRPLCCDQSIADELLPCVLIAAYGKIAQIDGLYLVRQTHNTRNVLPNWFRWITDEKWRPSYVWFLDKVATAISEIDGVSLQAAQATVEIGFAAYLKKWVRAESKTSKIFSERLRSIARHYIPAPSRAALRRICSRCNPGYISLEGLLDSASPYHRDIMPIWHAVTENKMGNLRSPLDNKISPNFPT